MKEHVGLNALSYHFPSHMFKSSHIVTFIQWHMLASVMWLLLASGGGAHTMLLWTVEHSADIWKADLRFQLLPRFKQITSNLS